MSQDLKQICVYCGSSPGVLPTYTEQAAQLGALLGSRGIGLIYGGAGIGIMGALADAVLANGGKVTGVMPRFLAVKEIAHEGLTEFIVVESMHQRKMQMADLSDAFIALPGGLGTFEELFEILTWAQLGLHEKPCGILNVAGYYNHLIRFLKHAAEQRFIKQEHRDLIVVDEDPGSLLTRLTAYQAPKVQKWLDLDQT